MSWEAIEYVKSLVLTSCMSLGGFTEQRMLECPSKSDHASSTSPSRLVVVVSSWIVQTSGKYSEGIAEFRLVSMKLVCKLSPVS